MTPRERLAAENHLKNLILAESEAESAMASVPRDDRRWWRRLNEVGRIRSERISVEQRLAQDDGLSAGKTLVAYTVLVNCPFHARPGVPGRAVFINDSLHQVACAECAESTKGAVCYGIPKRLYIACRLHDGHLRAAVLRVRSAGSLVAICPICIEHGRQIREDNQLGLGECTV